jgi:type III secretion protein K
MAAPAASIAPLAHTVPTARCAAGPAAAPAAGPMRLLRLVLGFNLHPQAALHPSWLPAAWPARHRAALRGCGPAAQAALAVALRRRGVLAPDSPLDSPLDSAPDPAPDLAFDAPLKRLLLLDSASLRRLAFYVSLCAHAPLLRPRRNPVSAQLRRQARRIDADAVEFVLERAPEPTALRMSAEPLQQRPASAGRVLMERGYRLLMAALASQGEPALLRLQQRLPRRVAALAVPALSAQQLDQLGELMLACIVPERLSAWDWLF